MSQFASGVTNPTPTAGATQLNLWTLYFTTEGDFASVKMFSWGGSDTSLVAVATQWGRVTSTPTTVSAFNVSPANPTVTNNFLCSTWTGTAATGTSGTYLFRQSWNSQGGGGAIVLPIGGEWRIISSALASGYGMIGCGNTTGTSTNLSFDVQWEE